MQGCHSVRYARNTRWCGGLTPNVKVLLRPFAKRSSHRAANLGSRSYIANIAMTAAMARLAGKSSGGWILTSHTRTSRYRRFMSDASSGQRFGSAVRLVRRGHCGSSGQAGEVLEPYLRRSVPGSAEADLAGGRFKLRVPESS